MRLREAFRSSPDDFSRLIVSRNRFAMAIMPCGETTHPEESTLRVSRWGRIPFHVISNWLSLFAVGS
jgi:hypothetical protein